MEQLKKILFFVTEDWYFCSHRLPLAVAAKKAGYHVSVVTRVRLHGKQIKKAGLKLIPLDMSRRGMNPIREFQIISRLVSIYRLERPDIVHHVALKPVLYGSIACGLARVPFVVNAMAGLGFLFSSNSLKARMFRPLVVIVLRFLFNAIKNRIILQNPDDVNLLCDSGVTNRACITLIRGSGVNTLEFTEKPSPLGIPLVILASRLLWDKGVGEFVEAAYLLKKQGVCARFALVGEGDIDNPTTVPENQLHAWREHGVVECWGRMDNMPDVLAGAHIICLPSYREGLPKVLIEAAACGKPIVTTDVPGCREIVQNGLNGFLVPLRDVTALADALKMLIDSSEMRMEMGMRGRKLVEKEFSIEKVNSETLALYEEMLQ